jgi:hypothetical protein
LKSKTELTLSDYSTLAETHCVSDETNALPFDITSPVQTGTSSNHRSLQRCSRSHGSSSSTEIPATMVVVAPIVWAW